MKRAKTSINFLSYVRTENDLEILGIALAVTVCIALSEIGTADAILVLVLKPLGASARQTIARWEKWLSARCVSPLSL